jgi:hypothetical protein
MQRCEAALIIDVHGSNACACGMQHTRRPHRVVRDKAMWLPTWDKGANLGYCAQREGLPRKIIRESRKEAPSVR